MFVFFFQAEDGIRDRLVTGVQACALPICSLEITHRVRVQPIVTRKADGTTTTFLGGASIESYIDRVWAQSGVVIEWAPEVEDINDFAYDGSSNDNSSAPRPQPDLRGLNVPDRRSVV
mgnify:CR=1 FL=1